MKEYPALSALRLGCVRYLNSEPLIHGLPQVELAHPAVLAQRLRAGNLDIALVPVFELLRSPASYWMVQGIGIASEGPVYSVFVAHTAPLQDVRAVLADPASLTSIHLFQLLARSYLQRDLPLLPRDQDAPPPTPDPALAQLWIGNQALEFRLRHGEEGMHYWDLGEAWRAWTGLPFVYAVWVIRRDIDEARARSAAYELRALADCGIAAIPRIANAQPLHWRQMAAEYLTRYIRFRLGESEMRGLERFSTELEQAGFLTSGRGKRRCL